MERLTVKWTDKVYDTLDPVDILDNEYSKTNYNKLLTKLGEYEDFEEIFREKMTDTACEFLKDKEEFSKWLDRTEWIVRKCDEYARAEEQGLLLRLPCKVGDKVYRINNGARKPIIPLYVVEIRFKQVGSYIREKICCSDDSMTNTASSIYYKEDIGNRIFLSKAEAKQKLKEMESD